MRILLLLLALFISQHSYAATLKLNYSLFFGYMKTIYKLDYQDVTTAFYLIDTATGAHCSIENAEIVVDNKREKIDFQRTGRLLPFYSDEHRKDGAMIEVETVTAENCALQVTPMVKEGHLEALNFARLAAMSTQLEGVLQKNAGMIGKYFLPTFQGLRFKLMAPIDANSTLDEGYQRASNGDLLVSNTVLKNGTAEKQLLYKVERITPWLVK